MYVAPQALHKRLLIAMLVRPLHAAPPLVNAAATSAPPHDTRDSGLGQGLVAKADVCAQPSATTFGRVVPSAPSPHVH